MSWKDETTEKLNKFLNDKLICIPTVEERGIVTDFIMPLIKETEQRVAREIFDVWDKTNWEEWKAYVASHNEV
jgi:hypothetical protein